jgi:type III secretion system FlhB-like substrate exporter
MADYWDGVLTNPQIVTDALREGLITTEAAKIEESLLRLRQDLIDPEETYSVLMARSALLSNTDGKRYIIEIAKTEEDLNAFWDRRSFDYIERQILSVDSLGNLTGNVEERAVAAQAIIVYSEAKRQAAAEGKALKGEELLALAHKIMIPFRKQVKSPLVITSPLLAANIPERLRVTPRPRRRFPPFFTAIDRTALGLQPRRRNRAPRTEADFTATYRGRLYSDFQ